MSSDFKIPETHKDEIYSGLINQESSSPWLRYFPSRIMMFKMMRACIDVDDPEDLWYMQLQKKIKISTNAKKKRSMMKRSTIVSDEIMVKLQTKIEEEVVVKETFVRNK